MQFSVRKMIEVSLCLSVCAVFACSGADDSALGSETQQLRLYASKDRAKAEKDCEDVGHFERGNETFYYCKKARGSCKKVKVCPDIYIEGADPEAMCSLVCEDHAVKPTQCGGTVSVSVKSDGTVGDESNSDEVGACLPTDVPGGTSPGCAQGDKNCESEPGAPSGGCEDAHVEGVCGRGEAKPSCCGVAIPG